MADNPTNLALLTLAQMFRGGVVRQIQRKVSFLKTIPIVSGRGQNLAWAPEADGALAENYSEGADATNFGADDQASAILPWGLYRANPHVTQLAMDAAASSSDPTGNIQAWQRTIENHCTKLAKTLEQECFVGPGTGTRLAGLDVAIGDDANTYATIDRTVGANAYWKPTVVDPGVDTAITHTLLRDDLRKIFEACGETPDFAWMSPTLFNVFGGTFDATRRNIDVVTSARGEVRLDAGFKALELDGTVFMKALDATAKTIYYTNTSDVKLVTLPNADQQMLLGEVKVEVNADDGFGEVPLNFAFEMLAKTGASSKAEILSTCQLQVTRPNAHGVRKHAI